ncbi:MAG: hypothetical protein A3G59_02930 [Candidatus Taylorbacteria bacterium RIFCSPLOWO2_12_FULL_47_20]|uniref:Uncharacterized protein n=2 Tax=Candidatus Tayloriibacteriota TaxID=1817919 RepID=A0A1G2P6G0_9BACT|nr:MAG: hypothetical protein A3H68_00775 [Candidatus Taylorbacteria bacterium RIFCSPLOWO2_02_FULL_46_40]OHA43900.1 MAG: hypothetical protein A3G59_02930 [Candidatus Taylorbacteria bacterium RIFCSPLOWO2_12_FULL_47_20]
MANDHRSRFFLSKTGTQIKRKKRKNYKRLEIENISTIKKRASRKGFVVAFHDEAGLSERPFVCTTILVWEIWTTNLNERR